MTTELKPCPFCGGKAEIHPSDDWDVSLTGATYFVWCDKCDTRGDYYNTEAEAIAAWNNRAERTCQLLRLGNEDICSFCGYAEEVDSAYIPNNYCPNCGAKVVE